MVVEDVPLHSAGNPRPIHSDICGLYYVLVVEYIVSIGFVDCVEKPAADFRQYAYFYIFIFKKERFVSYIFASARHIVV